MRKTSFAWFLVFAPAAVLYACGGSDNSTIDGGGDATLDGPGADSNNGDSSKDGSTDGNNTDGNNTDGGNGMDSGSDVKVTIACGDPAECVDGGMLDAAYPPSDGVVCCATVKTSGMGQPCNVDSVSTQCVAPGSCASMYGFSCGTDTFRACAHSAECTEAQFNKTAGGGCCTATLGDASATFCMDSTLKAVLKATCL